MIARPLSQECRISEPRKSHDVGNSVASVEFDSAVRTALVDAWRNAPSIPLAHQQMFRDMARVHERRSLGTLRIGAMLLALGSREAAYRVAAAIMGWADSIFGGSVGLESAWDDETREESESDIAIVRAMRSGTGPDLDSAIREQEEQLAAGMRLLGELKRRRARAS